MSITHDSNIRPAHVHTLMGMFNDLSTLGTCFTLLANLSRYVDTVAGSMLGGNLEQGPAEGFLPEIKTRYQLLRTHLRNIVADDSLTTEFDTFMPEIDDVSDVITAAVCVDQAYGWLTCKVSAESFERKLAVASMKMDLEERETLRTFLDSDRHPQRGLGAGHYV